MQHGGIDALVFNRRGAAGGAGDHRDRRDVSFEPKVGQRRGASACRSPEDGANIAWWLRLKGVRDVVSGLVLLAAMLWGGPQMLGVLLLIQAMIPLGDMSLVLACEGLEREGVRHPRRHGGADDPGGDPPAGGDGLRCCTASRSGCSLPRSSVRACSTRSARARRRTASSAGGYPRWWCRVTGGLEMAIAVLIALPRHAGGGHDPRCCRRRRCGSRPFCGTVNFPILSCLASSLPC